MEVKNKGTNDLEKSKFVHKILSSEKFYGSLEKNL
jgi:hypothetical protein